MMDNCSSEQAISPAIQHLVTCSIQAHFPPEFLNRIDETIFYVRQLVSKKNRPNLNLNYHYSVLFHGPIFVPS